MIILGAGMAGLLAGHIFRRHNPVIYEAQPSLPNNHEALLRFRSNVVAEATGVEFTQGTVRKAIKHAYKFEAPTPQMANMYSRKVLGEVHQRSIWNLEPQARWVAPPNFISQMAAPLNITYGAKIRSLDHIEDIAKGAPVISTIPMPSLMEILEHREQPQFRAVPIWSLQCRIKEPVCDVYQTIYYPDPRRVEYRASITGDRLIIEMIKAPGRMLDFILDTVLLDFGLEGAELEQGEVKAQPFGKIAPIDERIRRDFIYRATRSHGIYSLGRFATWRQVLLDDVVNDCHVIARLLSKDTYTHSLAAVGRS